jgi:hypothetical protein
LTAGAGSVWQHLNPQARLLPVTFLVPETPAWS